MNDLLMNHPDLGHPGEHPDNPSHAVTARNPIGTLAWARQTGGRLSSQERHRRKSGSSHGPATGA